MDEHPAGRGVRRGGGGSCSLQRARTAAATATAAAAATTATAAAASEPPVVGGRPVVGVQGSRQHAERPELPGQQRLLLLLVVDVVVAISDRVGPAATLLKHLIGEKEEETPHPGDSCSTSRVLWRNPSSSSSDLS